MYFFLEQQQRGREREGTGEAGVEGGKEGKGERPQATGQLSPPQIWQGKLLFGKVAQGWEG